MARLTAPATMIFPDTRSKVCAFIVLFIAVIPFRQSSTHIAGLSDAKTSLCGEPQSYILQYSLLGVPANLWHNSTGWARRGPGIPADVRQDFTWWARTGSGIPAHIRAGRCRCDLRASTVDRNNCKRKCKSEYNDDRNSENIFDVYLQLWNYERIWLYLYYAPGFLLDNT